ncbi:type III secretion system chaperone [Aureimonas sp. AU4]|uniref:type III secretion system chaperone n=1 Tax=Aureimonas sp. AU4 TaxID=1638163 RepID=UPI000A5559EE|nr:type III secretion system chaperone [Aureimonas sp. AU4]
MRDTDEALETLEGLSGIQGLRWDGNGQVELVFQRRWSVVVVRVDAARLELLSEIPQLGTDLPREALVQLLTANYLGEATGTGRISLDPRDGVVTFGLGLDVTRLDARALEAAFADFLRYLAFWTSPDAAGIVQARGPGDMAAAPADADRMIRI